MLHRDARQDARPLLGAATDERAQDLLRATNLTVTEVCVLVGYTSQPELDVTLMVPGPPLDDDMTAAVRRAMANGSMGGIGLQTDDCQKTFEELSAKGVEFVQPPSERPYGVEAILRDVSGNWLVLVEPREYSGEDFPH